MRKMPIETIEEFRKNFDFSKNKIDNSSFITKIVEQNQIIREKYFEKYQNIIQTIILFLSANIKDKYQVELNRETIYNLYEPYGLQIDLNDNNDSERFYKELFFLIVNNKIAVTYSKKGDLVLVKSNKFQGFDKSNIKEYQKWNEILEEYKEYYPELIIENQFKESKEYAETFDLKKFENEKFYFYVRQNNEYLPFNFKTNKCVSDVFHATQVIPDNLIFTINNFKSKDLSFKIIGVKSKKKYYDFKSTHHKIENICKAKMKLMQITR